MARPMQKGRQAPPLVFEEVTGTILQQRFMKTPELNPGGARIFAYDTFGAAPQSLVGAGTGLSRQGILSGQKPVVSLPVVGALGQAYVAGQYVTTPLSDNPNDMAGGNS